MAGYRKRSTTTAKMCCSDLCGYIDSTAEEVVAARLIAVLKNKDYKCGLQLCRILQELFPTGAKGYLVESLIHLVVTDVDSSIQILCRAIPVCVNPSPSLLLLGVLLRHVNMNVLAGKVLALYENYQKTPPCDVPSRSGFTHHASDKHYVILMNMILEHSLYIGAVRDLYNEMWKCVYSRLPLNSYQPLARRQLCFYVYPHVLPFYVQVVKCFSPDEIDIIFPTSVQWSAPFLTQLEVDDYQIYYGKEHLHNYNFVVGDHWMLTDIADNQIGIGLGHSHDKGIYQNTVPYLSAYIAPTLGNCLHNGLWLGDDARQNLQAIAPKSKCELAYSGAYNCDFDQRNYNSLKIEARSKLQDDLKFEIDATRPLIFCLDDNFSNEKQIIYCLNRLSEHATIIYKPMHSGALLNELRSNIITIDARGFSNNICRFAADYIMAGFCSGTLFSSLMMGLPIITYFSRMIANKYKKDTSSRLKRLILKDFYEANYCEEILSRKLYFPVAYRLMKFMKKKDLLFDLIDPGKIAHQFSNDQYLKRYRELLPTIHSEIFEKFYTGNAAQRTADLIRKFCRDLTFGDDTISLYHDLKTKDC